MKSFGAIYGFMSALMALASGVGPLLAGAMYDYSGHYSNFLIIGAIACALGGAIILSMPSCPKWRDDLD